MILSLKDFTISVASLREEAVTDNEFKKVFEDSIWVFKNVFRKEISGEKCFSLGTSISATTVKDIDTIIIKIVNNSSTATAGDLPILKIGSTIYNYSSSDDNELKIGFYEHLLTYNIATTDEDTEEKDYISDSLLFSPPSDKAINIYEIKVITKSSILSLLYNNVFDIGEGETTQIIKTFIPLTIYERGKNNITTTYNEKLTEKENSSYSLTFNVEMFVNGHRNPMLEYLVNDRMIRLTRGFTIIDFYITGRTPVFSSNNVCYSITCQDAFSWQLSKQKLNFNFSTEDENIWGAGQTGPKTIYELSSKILEMAKLNYDWTIDKNLQNNIMEFPNNLYDVSGQLKVSIDLSGTNPYNAIVEVAKLFNAQIEIDYSTQPINIYFYNKEKLLYKGTKLNPEINLSAFSYNDKSDNLYNVMHVTGGEDANGSYISMLPTMPSIVSELLITFSKTNVYSSVPSFSEEEYYSAPYYYIVYTKGASNPYTLYKKGSKGEGTTVSYSSISTNGANTPKLANGINLFWEDIVHTSTSSGTKQIYNMLTYYLDNISSLLGANYTIYKTNLFNYFNDLSLFQHASSSFYNFDYWKENKLLTENRYDKLMYTINNDLRNINLLLNSYVPVYNSIKYKLDKIIDQEMEYMAFMSAEDQSMALYDEGKDSDTTGYMSLRGLYSSNSIMIETEYQEEDKKKTYKSYYIMIGCCVDNKVYYQVQSFNAESKKPETYITHYLPDFNVIKTVLGENGTVYTINNELAGSCLITSYNESNETFTINDSNDLEPIYIKYYEEAHGENEAYDITGSLAGGNTDLLPVDTIYNQRILDYMQNVSTLWNDMYKYYYLTIYGGEWLDTKVNDITEKYQVKLAEKTSLENQLKSGFGENWRDIQPQNLSHSKLVEYSDLTEQLNTVGYYVGGIGTRKDSSGDYYTYKGMYDYYLDCIKAYLYGNTQSTNDLASLSDIINNINVQKDSWETEFYKNYGDVIRETTYSDTDQLTPSGLYSSAWKQFKQYNQPTKSYSASYISTENLTNVGEEVNVGEVVKLKHNLLKEIVKPNYVKLTVNTLSKTPSTCLVKYVGNMTPENSNGTLQACFFNVISRVGNTLVLKDSRADGFDINNDTIYEIIADGISYKFGAGRRIECIEKVYHSEDIDLRITGITKDLRSNVAQLTVEENTLYNTLVDRLVYLLKTM